MRRAHERAIFYKPVGAGAYDSPQQWNLHKGWNGSSWAPAPTDGKMPTFVRPTHKGAVFAKARPLGELSPNGD